MSPPAATSDPLLDRGEVFVIRYTPSDAQIAYALADFIKDVRSLSADPVVVRANWTDALDHVTARGAQALDAYARDETSFDKIGRRTVLVTKVARTGQDTFNIRWEEQTTDNGVAVRHEHFTVAISIALHSPNTPALITKNPLGLYVDRFTWCRERSAAGLPMMCMMTRQSFAATRTGSP